jgi:hypothetical protein
MRFQDRQKRRSDWYAAALAATHEADLIFIDPDNGIESKIKRTAKKGPKYVYWDDVKAFVIRGQSVVIYHHLGRIGTHDQQIKKLMAEMSQRFPAHAVLALKFRRGAGRAYFVLAATAHLDLLRTRINEILTSRWKEHFSLSGDTSKTSSPIDEPDPVQLCNDAAIVALQVLDRMEDESCSSKVIPLIPKIP